MPGINSSTDKCLWAARFRGSDPQSSRCMICFINNPITDASAITPPTLANIQIEHFFVRGPYVPYICGMCERSYVKEKAIDQCLLCRAKLTDLLDCLTERGIPADETRFMYNVYEDKLLYLVRLVRNG